MANQNRNYPTRMHEVLDITESEVIYGFNYFGGKWWFDFFLSDDGTPFASDCVSLGVGQIVQLINHPERIIRKPRPGCWHCWNIEAHKIEYVTAVKDKDGRPMNTPTDIPYRYCPSCGRKLGVEG